MLAVAKLRRISTLLEIPLICKTFLSRLLLEAQRLFLILFEKFSFARFGLVWPWLCLVGLLQDHAWFPLEFGLKVQTIINMILFRPFCPALVGPSHPFLRKIPLSEIWCTNLLFIFILNLLLFALFGWIFRLVFSIRFCLCLPTSRAQNLVNVAWAILLSSSPALLQKFDCMLWALAILETEFGRPIFIQCGHWGELCSPYEVARPQPSTG